MRKTSEFFPRNLRTLREKSGLKQAELAEKVGVNVKTYQKYEYGTATPSEDKKEALASLFKIALADLVYAKDILDPNIPKPVSLSRADLMISLYSEAPTLTEDELQNLVTIARGYNATRR